MAVKKSTTKRVVKKAVAKKSVAKKTAKKSVARKSVAKKSATKKTTAKKSVAKKSVVKKTAKKTTKKVAKKSAVKKSATSTFTVPPVPSRANGASERVNVSTTPVVNTPKASVAAKPVVAPAQGTSKAVRNAVILGIVLLALVVWTKSSSKKDEAAVPAPSMSASPSAQASTSAAPVTSASKETTANAAVATVEAPSKFVALKSATGLTLRWVAPTATTGLTGYNVEIRANGNGDWKVIATVPGDQLTQSVTQSDGTGWTQFRVTSVYSDGQTASATVFGIPGVFA